ncbi:MAG: hypothetical protein K5981_06965 [Clostridia bacterium]|nr:hypothetical protein [Clostridia bacterium]
MADYSGFLPEEHLPEEVAPPAPGVCPPPEEGSSGAMAEGRRDRQSRGGKIARLKKRSALLLAAAGVALCGVVYAAPMTPAKAWEPPAETAAVEPAEEPEPETPVAVNRLVEAGTWKNEAESEWVHFNEDGSGWWYDGTYFGFMEWTEDADGGFSYKAIISWIGPERKYVDDYFPEKEGDTLLCKTSRGSIELSADGELFTCPGLKFGEGTYAPDDTVIDASAAEDVCGKTLGELLSGTTWHMVEYSDLGIPVAPSEDKGLYTDLVYVQSMDFAAGTFRIAARDGGLLQKEIHTEDGRVLPEGAVESTLDVPFTIDAEAAVSDWFDLYIDFVYTYCSDYIPGDTEYNNMHLLWGQSWDSSRGPSAGYLVVTEDGIRVGTKVDLYPNNYTLLAPD